MTKIKEKKISVLDKGYVRFRNGGDEDCSECNGEGMKWASSEDGEEEGAIK